MVNLGAEKRLNPAARYWYFLADSHPYAKLLPHLGHITVLGWGLADGDEQMSDPCILEFNERVQKIEKARAKGYGFEADGTLGRSHYTRRKARRASVSFPFLRPALAMTAGGTVLKAIFLVNLGAAAYDSRVERLLDGHGFDRIGGWLMQADPVTIQLSSAILGAVALFG